MSSTMSWGEYKEAVDGSRRKIVFPFFEARVLGEAGIGVDVGCGDGDLTAHLAGVSGARMIGVDNSDYHIDLARRRQVDLLHFVNGDVERNAIASIGIRFDFAVSNCCLTHLSDDGVHELFLDLHAAVKTGGNVSFLVPSVSWARDKYRDLEFVRNGAVATPRYGGPQNFRLPEWYMVALERCGFVDVKHRKILIPDDQGLEQRYREHIGEVLFDAITAKNSDGALKSDRNEKAFDIAHQNRGLEIGLFWQRSLFFWGFVAAALVAFGAAFDKSDWLATIFSLFGLVCSVVWSAGNRGSKYWQEYWEKKVNLYQHFVMETSSTIGLRRSRRYGGTLLLGGLA